MSTATTNNRNPAMATTEAEKVPGDILLDRVVAATHAARYTMEEVRYMAKAAGLSGMFGMNESQAFVLMMIAESRGLHPIEAVQRYHVIHGRPAMKAEAMLAELMARGWEVTWLTEEDDPSEQAATFRHPRKQPKGQRIGFTMERAKAAELKTDTWRKYPANMLRARTISNACRMLDPGIVIGLYTPEEILDSEDNPRPAPILDLTPDLAPAPSTEPRKLAPVSREYSEPVLPQSDIRRWIGDTVTARNDIWRNHCLIEQVEYKPLVSSAVQVANHLVKTWIAEGVLDEATIQTDGKRDPARVAECLKTAWAQDSAEIQADVMEYLKAKLAERAREAGVQILIEGETISAVPLPATAGTDADEHWQEGRE